MYIIYSSLIILNYNYINLPGPSQAKIDCVDKGDGSADVSYLPTVAGEYAVHVLCDNEDIPQSPFMAQIGPPTREFNPGQVKTLMQCA